MSVTAPNFYERGDQLACYTILPFQNDSGIATDPTSVVFTLAQPAPLAPLVYRWYGIGDLRNDAPLVRLGTGSFIVMVFPTASGEYSYTIAGTGAVQRSLTRVFIVKLPPF